MNIFLKRFFPNYATYLFFFTSKKGRPHWRRTGEDICYFRNGFSKSSQINGDNYMTASFTITFPHDGDICYLAYHYPYTYSRLKTNLEKLATKNSRKDNNIYLKIDQLTESLGEFFTKKVF